MREEPQAPRPIAVDQLTLVPPARIGRVLTEARQRSGSAPDDLAAASAGEFTIDDLTAAEAGIIDDVDPTRLERLMMLYAASPGDLLPGRTELVIDLESGTVAAGPFQTHLPGRVDHPDDVLARYLAFVYEMRHLAPGTPIPLRVVDLEVLSATLRLPVDDVAGRLEILMIEPAGLVARWREQLSARVLVPGAAVIIAVGAAGALVLGGGGTPVVVGADLGSRVSFEASIGLSTVAPPAPDEATSDAATTDPAAPGPAPQPAPDPDADAPEIDAPGGPLTIENPDGTGGSAPAPSPDADAPEIDAPGGPLVIEADSQPAPSPEADVPEIDAPGGPLVVENVG